MPAEASAIAIEMDREPLLAPNTEVDSLHLQFERENRRCLRHFVVLAAILLIIFAVSARLGRYPLALSEIFRFIGERIQGVERSQSALKPEVYTVLLNIRLPRLLVCLMVGTALSVAGSAFQSIFNNPMVSPDVLGASSGAGLFAAMGILLGLPRASLILCSFIGGLLSILVVLSISRYLRFEPLLSLILTGMIVNSLFSACLSLLKYIADPNNELPAITYWLMGSFSGVSRKDVGFVFWPVLIGTGIIIAYRWRLNLLSLGSDSAKSLGIHLKRDRAIILMAATLLTAASVSVAGMISWVGLVIPHFAKIYVGADHRRAIPAAALMGAAFLLLVDDLARLLSTGEIPLGVLTAFVGAPIFLYLIFTEGRR